MTKLYQCAVRLWAMRLIRLTPLIGLAMLAACGTTENPRPQRTERDKQRVAAAIEKHEVRIGMTKSEVIQSIGKPMRKKSVRFYGRPRQRWDYSSFSVFFTEDGFVVLYEGAGY